MMIRLLKYLAASVAILLVSCSKDSPADDRAQQDDIVFAVSAPGLNVTKAEIRDDQPWQVENDVTQGKVGVRIHETLIPDFLYGHRLIPEVLTGGGYSGRWFPESQSASDRYRWHDYLGQEMSFFGFAFSPFRDYGSKILVTEGSRGRDVTITQPNTYGEESVDYMLSYQTNIPAQQAGNNYPLITLNLEHATSLVELYIDCEEVFSKEPDRYEIRLRELTFNDIYWKARLTCTHHAVAGTQDENVWSVEYDKTYITDYSLPLDRTDSDGRNYALLNVAGTDGPIKVMEFLALPASHNMPYSLTVKYDVIEKKDNLIVERSSFAPAPFILRNYTTDGWRSGHRVKYNLSIDNGINLSGNIADWVEMEYIEGVILPKNEFE